MCFIKYLKINSSIKTTTYKKKALMDYWHISVERNQLYKGAEEVAYSPGA